jgi:DNA replication protein DnaC
VPPDETTKPQAWICPKCGARNEPRWIGWQAPNSVPHWHLYQRCDPCLAREEQERWQRQELEARKQTYLEKYGFLDPASLYAGMTFANYHARTKKQREAKAAIEALTSSWLRDGFVHGAILFSPVTLVGVGKTHLAVAAARFACEHMQSIAIWGMPSYVDAIKASYDNGGADKVQQSAQEPAVLVLDDIGVENVKSVEWYQNLVYNIVDARWLKQRATLVTTNMPLQILSRHIGARAISRLMAITGPMIELDGTDYRLTGGKA